MIVLLGQYNTFVRTLTKTLYCPKKTNPFLQKCCTVPKKPKKTILSSLQRATDYRPSTRFVFFGTVQHFCKKRLVFFGTVQHFCKKINKNTVLSQKNQSFFAKVLYCPKKTKKNQSFQVLGPRRATKMEKIGFFGFFGTVQHFCKKRLVFLGQYSTFARKLTKTLYCPKKTNLFCKSAVLS